MAQSTMGSREVASSERVIRGVRLVAWAVGVSPPPWQAAEHQEQEHRYQQPEIGGAPWFHNRLIWGPTTYHAPVPSDAISR